MKTAATTAQPISTPMSGKTRWIARIGLAGFMFFLIKGLLWLIIPAVLVAISR